MSHLFSGSGDIFESTLFWSFTDSKVSTQRTPVVVKYTNKEEKCATIQLV